MDYRGRVPDASPVVQAKILVVQGLLCGNSSEKVPYYREKGLAYSRKGGQNKLPLRLELGACFGHVLFVCPGGGDEGVRGARNGGGALFLSQERGGDLPEEGVGGVRSREGVCGELGGGGPNMFFAGPKDPPSEVYARTVGWRGRE